MELLQQSGGLQGLANRGIDELCRVPGVGPAKAAQLKAALELGKRANAKCLKREQPAPAAASPIYGAANGRFPDGPPGDHQRHCPPGECFEEDGFTGDQPVAVREGGDTRQDRCGHPADRLCTRSTGAGFAFRRSFLIGLMYDNPNAQYIVNIQDGVLDALRGSGFELVVHPCDRLSEDFLPGIRRFIERQKLHGVVLLPPISEDQMLAQALQRRLIVSTCVSRPSVWTPLRARSYVTTARQPLRQPTTSRRWVTAASD